MQSITTKTEGLPEKATRHEIFVGRAILYRDKDKATTSWEHQASAEVYEKLDVNLVMREASPPRLIPSILDADGVSCPIRSYTRTSKNEPDRKTSRETVPTPRRCFGVGSSIGWQNLG